MRYPGGKGSCFRHIVNLMPAHHTYIETHLGGGNVLERKRPAARNIGIDVDDVVIARWREVGRRLPFDLELHCMDAVQFLKAFPFKGGEVVYCDPPYLHSTRRTVDIYRYEYTDAQHLELLSVLVTLPCFVIVSGYASSLYREMLQQRHGWRCVEFPNTTRGGRVIESAWCNFPSSAQLHDCRYAGDNFRERERIKRKRARWRSRFAAMPPAERQVVLEALLEISSPDMAARDLADPLAKNGEPRASSGPIAVSGDADRHGVSDGARSYIAVGSERIPVRCPRTIDWVDA